MRVLREKKRLKAAFLGRTGNLRWANSIMRGKNSYAKFHRRRFTSAIGPTINLTSSVRGRYLAFRLGYNKTGVSFVWAGSVY